MRRLGTTGLWMMVLLGALGASGADRPPGLVNYQGVLRGADDRPLDGNHDMVFRFFDAEIGGNEILVDSHLASGGQAVIVSGGLFSTALGGGTVTDGSGPSTYTTLSLVFANHSEVWLSVEIEGELLDPRVRVIAAAYAHNADYLRGRSASYFLHTGGTPQTKTGMLTVDTTGDATYGIEAYGDAGGGYFADPDDSAVATVAVRNTGISASGTKAGGSFSDSNGTGYGAVGAGDFGVNAYGTEAGGYFADEDGTGVGWVGYGNSGVRGEGSGSAGSFFGIGANSRGVSASGGQMGASFTDSDASGIAYLAYGEVGVKAYGTEGGGFFASETVSPTATAWIARTEYGEGYGIHGRGTIAGGWFEDMTGTGFAHLGYGNVGIRAEGSSYGGRFENIDNSGKAYLGEVGSGVRAFGSSRGGYFYDSNDSGLAYVGSGDYGIEAHGDVAGGYFAESLNSPAESFVYLAQSGGATMDGTGIWAESDGTAGYFRNTDGAGFGVDAWGSSAGGRFTVTDTAGYGVEGTGPTGGGYFTDSTSGNYGRVGFAGYKIYGVGAVSFVQNHPYDDDRVIVYAAPEGDEVAVYTRGSTRLVQGEARVLLGETFRWVTNPDVGLTAYVTPRGECQGLYVASVSPEELLVRELGGGTSDAIIDYLVFGLRIGFEESSVVQVKEIEAYIPSMEDHRELYENHPELRRFNALERFRDEREALGLGRDLDLRTSLALRGAIAEFDPELHEHPVPPPTIGAREEVEPRLDSGNAAPTSTTTDRPPQNASIPVSAAGGSRYGVPMDEEGNIYGRSFRPASADLASMLPVAGAVEPGDVVVLDAENPGVLRPASVAGDPRVFGVVAAQPGLVLGADQTPAASEDPAGEANSDEEKGVTGQEETLGVLEAPVAFTGVVLCKVDAGYGSIRPGDLLSTSPTPGHAMRTTDPLPGTVLGKAIDALEGGTGLIRVLVTLR